MDIGIVVSTLFDFLKLLILASIVFFIVYKIFSPVRQNLAEKYSLSWVKSCLLLNFSVSFVLIFLLFLHFMFIGFFNAPFRDPAIEFDVFENILLVLLAVPRMLITAIITSGFLLFFELLASMFMKSEKKGTIFGEFKGIIVSSAVFIILFLFVFDWAALGLFIFVFYGYIKPLPLIFLV
jgi:hypothetical protein